MLRKKQWIFILTALLLSLALIGCEPTADLMNQANNPENIQETEETEVTEMEETGTPEETENPEETETPTESPTPEDGTEAPAEFEAGEYRIEFMGFKNEEDGTSTWEYLVQEMEDAQDLSYWVLELPGCVRVKEASPEPYEVVAPDPNTELYGIKWETGAGFSMGTFTVTLYEQWAVDERAVAFKGPDVYYGEIAGPTCGEDMEDEDWDNPYWNEGYDGEAYEMRCEDLDIPYGQLPPEGECKLWNPYLDDGQQSEPIPCDCAFIEPDTCLIDHEGEVIECEMDDDDNGEDNGDDYTNICMDLEIPAGQYPPPGECKLWDPDLDDGQQSEPIPCDCAYIEPGTCLIDHEGDVLECEMDNDDVGEDDDYSDDDDYGDDDDDEDNTSDDDEAVYESLCSDLEIPAGQYPPPGECKLWDPDLDDGQQSEPIPCDCSYIEQGTCLINHEGELINCD